jgi:hypothetical protein
MTAIAGFTHTACTRISRELYRLIQNRVSTFRNVTHFVGRAVVATASVQTLLSLFSSEGMHTHRADSPGVV